MNPHTRNHTRNPRNRFENYSSVPISPSKERIRKKPKKHGLPTRTPVRQVHTTNPQFGVVSVKEAAPSLLSGYL